MGREHTSKSEREGGSQLIRGNTSKEKHIKKKKKKKKKTKKKKCPLESEPGEKRCVGQERRGESQEKKTVRRRKRRGIAYNRPLRNEPSSLFSVTFPNDEGRRRDA